MSETANLKLFKHDNPSTNTNPFDIENSINKNWDKIDQAIGTNKEDIANIKTKNNEQDTTIGNKVNKVEGKGLSTNDFTNAYKNKLDGLSNYDDTEIKEDISAIQEEQETQNTDIESLKIENENIKKENVLLKKDLQANQITDTVEGNSLELKDCSSARLVELGIEGNSYQKTRSGKNKCPTNINDWEYGHYGINGAKENWEHRIRLKELLKVEPSTTYYFDNFNSNYFFAVRTYDNNKNFVKSVGSITNTQTYTTTADEHYLGISLYNADTNMTLTLAQYTALFNNGTIKPFICLNSETNKNFEEYGVMPSVDYPSEVKSCGDNINIFDGKFRQGSTSNIKDSIRIFSSQELLLEKGETYTFSTNLDLNLYRYAALINKNKYPTATNAFFETGWQTTTMCTFTPPEDGYLGINIRKIDNSNITLEDIKGVWFKLEKGTLATPYSPYNQGSINIVRSNKNLFKPEKLTFKTSNDIQLEVVDGVATLTGTATTLFEYSSEYVPISSNIKNLTISGTNNNKGISVAVYVYDKNKKYITGIRDTTEKGATLEITNEMKFFAYQIRIAKGTTLTNQKVYAQLESGTIKTTIVPHQEQTYPVPVQKPFRAIGNVKDKFIKKDGKRYECHRIRKVVLDGSQNISSIKNTKNNIDTYNFDFEILNGSKEINANKIICDKFISKYNDYNDYEHCRNSTIEYCNRCIIYINKSRLVDISTEAKAKESMLAWLQANPVTIYYVLAIPELIVRPKHFQLFSNMFQNAYFSAVYIIFIFNQY